MCAFSQGLRLMNFNLNLTAHRKFVRSYRNEKTTHLFPGLSLMKHLRRLYQKLLKLVTFVAAYFYFAKRVMLLKSEHRVQFFWSMRKMLCSAFETSVPKEQRFLRKMRRQLWRLLRYILD